MSQSSLPLGLLRIGLPVAFAHPENGYDLDREVACEHLIPGCCYKVAGYEIGGFSSRIMLAEVPGVWFNTVLFDVLPCVVHLPCTDPLCEEGDDCVRVDLIREPGDPDLELAPFYRACNVSPPACGSPLREHEVEELRARAEEQRAYLIARGWEPYGNEDSRLLDRLWLEEMDRYRHRCDRELHKCGCAEAEEDEITLDGVLTGRHQCLEERCDCPLCAPDGRL